MAKDNNQIMKLKRRKGNLPSKTSQNIKVNNTNQNQNRQIHQTKLEQHWMQHKTERAGQREKRQNCELHRNNAINDKRQRHTTASPNNNKLTKTFFMWKKTQQTKIPQKKINLKSGTIEKYKIINK